MLIFFKINFWKENFSNAFGVSTGLDPDQDRHFVGPDLDPNCVQRLSYQQMTKVATSKKKLTTLAGVFFTPKGLNCDVMINTTMY